LVWYGFASPWNYLAAVALFNGSRPIFVSANSAYRKPSRGALGGSAVVLSGPRIDGQSDGITEGTDLNCRQEGFIDSGVLIILIGGLALGGLFIHSLSTGQDLPVWPAVAVILVNLIGAAKIVIGVMNAKKLRQEQSGKVKPK